MEQSLGSARATVMTYDEQNKRWMPAGPSQTQGVSKVHIFRNPNNGACRVVGRKLQDHEVVLNCAVMKNLRYNQATATFHQWRDQKLVYGLNFVSKEEADAFANTMQLTVDSLVPAQKNSQLVGPQASDSACNSFPTEAQRGSFINGSSPQATFGQFSTNSVSPANELQVSRTDVPTMLQQQSQESLSTNDEILRSFLVQQQAINESEQMNFSNSSPNQQIAPQSAPPSTARSPFPAVGSLPFRNGVSTQFSTPPVSSKPAPSSVLQGQNNQATKSVEIPEKENSPPEHDGLAAALRSVKLRKAADPGHHATPASGAGDAAISNDASSNGQLLNARLTSINDISTARQSAVASPAAGIVRSGSLRGPPSIGAGTSDVFSEMQRVFAARKARVDAASSSETSIKEVASTSVAATIKPTENTNDTDSTNLKTTALDAPVTLKELKNLKAELIAELRREIAVLKTEIIEAIRCQGQISRR